MNLTSLVAKLEQGMMRRLPPAAVVRFHHVLHRLVGEPELRHMREFVRRGTVAVDVGAHFGVYTLALARLVGKDGSVLSFEPMAEDANLLTRATQQMRLPVTVIPCAVSSESGEQEMRVPLFDGAAKTALSTLGQIPQVSANTVTEMRTVKVTTLDEALENVELPVSFVKIDVEGHELDVLAGAERTLARHRPTLMVEINDDIIDAPIRNVFDLIEAKGYRGVFLEDGRTWRSLDQFDVKKHQHASGGRVLSRHYVNNFVFLPQ